ncbi:MAG: sulfite exporter TauE/SafE family protein [Desulfovibrionaceae bacterium]
MFWLAVQSSLMLGLIHGVNPCGHSWPVLAPFVTGERKGGRVALLTAAFIGGTAVACVALGVSLGAVSAIMTETVRHWADVVTDAVLVVLGGLLIVRPGLLHSHGHGHDHDGHDHAHGDHAHAPVPDAACGACGGARRSVVGRMSAIGLFSLAFVNMIIPCPTVAMMYSYAVESGSVAHSTIVFAVYALGTGFALALVIYAIYRVASLVRKLQQVWIEELLMRLAGLLTASFGVYGFMAGH